MSRLDYIKDIKLHELSFERIKEAISRRLENVVHKFLWMSKGSESREKLLKYKNKYEGERCFVIANGPSLKKTDLSKLSDEYCIIMNRFYENIDSLNKDKVFLAVMDYKIQIKQFFADLNKVDIPFFANWEGRNLLIERDNLAYLFASFKPQFSMDPTQSIWGGHSVTYTCLQLAFWMGFKEVILIGKDHSYKEQGRPGETIVSDGKEDNHFKTGYYKEGMKWKIPDYKGEELAYSMARTAFEQSGRSIKDATIGGQLDIFQKVDYNSLFKNNEESDTKGV